MAENDQVETPSAATRRTVLRGALVAGVATPLLAACGSNDSGASNNASTTSQSSGGGSTDSGTNGGADVLAKTSDVPEGSGIILADPGIVITQPSSGQFEGFTNICQHMGCPLHDVTDTINCNCHGSQYSIEDGSVVTGPATKALPKKPVVVSGTDISQA